MAHVEAIAALEDLLEPRAGRQRGLWSDAFRRVIRNRLAMAGIIILIGVLIITVLGNYVDSVQRYDTRVQEFDSLQDPSSDHYFGTDQLGRDNWARVLQGTWV